MMPYDNCERGRQHLNRGHQRITYIIMILNNDNYNKKINKNNDSVNKNNSHNNHNDNNKKNKKKNNDNSPSKQLKSKLN